MPDNTPGVKIRHEADAAIVELAGDLDLHHAPEVHQALVQLCAAEPARLIIDLQSIKYMDSSGIGTLVAIFRQVNGYGGKLVLCSPGERVRSMLEITKLDKFFAIRQNLAEALSA